jgi:hypothetical protein
LCKICTHLSHSTLYRFHPQPAPQNSPPQHQNPTNQWEKLQEPNPLLCPMSLRDRGSLDGKEEAEPASENTPSSTPEIPLYTPLKKRGLTYPYTTLSRRSDRRPLSFGRAPRSELTRTRTPLPFTYMTRHVTRTSKLFTTLFPIDYTNHGCYRTPTGADPSPLSLPVKACSGC